MGKIVCFFHVATMGHYKEVNEEMLNCMESSGFLDRIDTLYISCIESHPLDLPDKFKRDKIKIINQGLDIGQFEYPTLESLKDYCFNNPNDIVVYCCNAGVSHSKDKKDLYPGWRLLKSHFTFNRWRDNLKALKIYDVCGIEWQTEPKPHFSGNFWWANATYINTLPSIEKSRQLGLRLFRPFRHGAEMWLGMNPKCQYRSLFQTGYDWLNRPVINWYEEAKRCEKL